MATEAQLDTIRAIFEAIAMGDVGAAERRVSDDFELVTSAFITGEREFRGVEGVERWFQLVEELKGSGERVTLRPHGFLGDRADPAVILALVTVTIGRLDGEEIGADAAYLFRLADERITSARGFMEHADGIAELSDPYELAR